jgi:GAF domain-containing protein
VGWVTSSRQPRIALDVGADAVHFKNPDLPETRSEMALPLIVGDRLLGALDVQSTQEAAFDEEDMATLTLMADQVAVALDNALKFSQEAAILEATSPLYRASRGIAMAANLDDVVGSIVVHSAGSHVDHCAIHLYTAAADGSQLGWVEIAAVWDGGGDLPYPAGSRYPVKGSNLMECFRQGGADPVIVSDLKIAGIDDRIDAETYQFLTDTLRLQAVLMLPITVARRPLGLLLVASRRPHIWTDTELRTFRSLSDHAAVAVENIRLLEEAQARAWHERAIRQLTEQMRRAVDMETILKATVAGLGDVMGVPRVYVRLGTEARLTPNRGDRSWSSSEPGHSSHPLGPFSSSGDSA